MMLSLSSAGSAQQDITPTKKRNRVMCQRCRHDKQGCHPSDRDWNAGQKCTRCTRLGYDCSAPEKAPPKQRKKRLTSTTTVTKALSSSTSLSAHAKCAEHSVVQPSGRTQKLRPLSAFGAEAESVLDEDPVPPAAHCDADGAVTSTRKSSEQEARIILSRLGDLNATQVILRSNLALCDQVESWLGPSQGVRKIRSAISAAITAVQSEFVACWKDAKTFTPKDMGPKEAFLAQLEYIKYRFLQPPQPMEFRSNDDLAMMDDLDDDDVRDMLHELHKRKKIWSAADYLFGSASGKPLSRRSIHASLEADVVVCYLSASEGIKNVISNLVLPDADHRNILSGFSAGFSQISGDISPFPPCHLAVPQANASMLFDLWKKSQMPLWDVDCLQRTPVHTAAYSSNVQGLQQIFHSKPLTATNTGHDAFGLTPLAIAACKDDVVTFIRLEKAGADILEHTTTNIVDGKGMGLSVLALAARNGSMKVVQHILTRPQIPFSFIAEDAELCQALSAGHIPIARILIESHCAAGVYDLSDQIPAAKKLAEEKGLRGIHDRLTGIQPIYASSREAINSLDDSFFNSWINPDATWDMQTHYDSSQSMSNSGLSRYNWSSQATTTSSFSYLEMQEGNLPPSISSAPTRRSTITPNDASSQIRHRGPTRIDPP